MNKGGRLIYVNQSNGYLPDNFDESKLGDIADKIAVMMRDEINKAKAVASGDLANFDTILTLSSTTIKLSFDLQAYWRWVEDGRPMTSNGGSGELVEKIKKWIQVKNIRPKPIPTTRTYKSGVKKVVLVTPNEQQLAFLITRKIHREGYEGKHFYSNFINNLKSSGLIGQFTNELCTQLARGFITEIYE